MTEMKKLVEYTAVAYSGATPPPFEIMQIDESNELAEFYEMPETKRCLICTIDGALTIGRYVHVVPLDPEHNMLSSYWDVQGAFLDPADVLWWMYAPSIAVQIED